MKSKKLHYLQTEKKVVNPEDVSGERIKFCPFFKFLRGPTGSKLVHI